MIVGAGKGSGAGEGQNGKTVVWAKRLCTVEIKSNMVCAGSGAGGGLNRQVLGMAGVFKAASCWELLHSGYS
eukprot:11031629-Ditylum_brightwellii.AAC.1